MDEPLDAEFLYDLDFVFAADVEEAPPIPGTDFQLLDAADPFYITSKFNWMQIPLPEHLAPTGGAPLAALSDDDLLSMSPALIVHAMRTAASGGLQVISPRQTPLSSLGARVVSDRRTPDMFLVGSVASSGVTWPVLSEPPPATLLDHDVLDSASDDPALRMNTRTEGLVSTTAARVDPMTKAFVTGRAMIDLQMRPDVMGNYDVVAHAIASSWGLGREAFSEWEYASIAPMGSLLRYAIRADAVYPVHYAPIQARKCLSVGASTLGREMYGAYCAVDWRRMRVLCEAAFYLASRIEKHKLTDLVSASPPGDPRARPRRPGILQFRPMYGAVWSFDPRTFRLDRCKTVPIPAAAGSRTQLLASLRQFYGGARAAAVAMALGAEIHVVPSDVAPVPSTSVNALVTGYRKLLTRATTVPARGKIAASSTRNFLYNVLTDGGASRLSEVAWVLLTVRTTVRDLEVPLLMDDVLISRLSRALYSWMPDIRARISAEADKRGESLDAWWEDIVSSLPTRYKLMPEDSLSWVVASIYYMLRPFSPKWVSLLDAVRHNLFDTSTLAYSRTARLPIAIGSPERIWAAVDACSHWLREKYSAFYGAVAIAANMLYDSAMRMGLASIARILKFCELTWDIRRSVAQTMRVVPGPSASEVHYTTVTDGMSFHVVVSPYRAYANMRSWSLQTGAVLPEFKRALPEMVQGSVSEVLSQIPFGPIPSVGVAISRLTRYFFSMSALADDMEKTVKEMRTEIKSVVQFYAREDRDVPFDLETPTIPQHGPSGLQEVVTAIRAQIPPGGYWDLITELSEMDARDVDDAFQRLDEQTQDAILARRYPNAEAMRDDIMDVVSVMTDPAISNAIL
jgi:hypothetical protein